MSSTQHLVSPKLPTVLADDTRVDLPGHDTYFYFVENVHVVPTKLDVSKLEDALSRALQVYPHAAGHLRSADGCWFIELSNTPIPVDVEYKLDKSSASVLDGDWVVQDDLSSLLNQQSNDAELVNGSAPLLRVKLTFFDHETSIGVSWNHSLGDGITISRFMHLFSQFYQDPNSEFAKPSFKKHQFPEPSSAMLAALAARMPPRQANQAGEVAPPGSYKDPEYVRWRFDDHDLEELRAALNANDQNKKHLSKQDCLAAYFAAVLNHNKASPLTSVRTVSSYRHIRAPFVDENVAGNLILLVPATVPADMVGIAIAIREALEQFREPSRISLLGSMQSKHMLAAANAGKFASPAFRGDELFVNSNVAIDWCSGHFGFPDGARFHSSRNLNLWLCCYKSNPVKGEDGKWQARQSIDISVGVPAEMQPKVLETLGRGVRYLLDNQPVQA